LSTLGVTGTFDANTIRVSLDSAPSQELTYDWISDGSPAGKLEIATPDGIAGGTPLPLHVYFDITENGFKPASLYTRGLLGRGGFTGNFYRLDSAHTTSFGQPSGLVYFTPPVVSRFETTTIISPSYPFPFAAGLPSDNFVTIWDGAMLVPATGAYNF